MLQWPIYLLLYFCAMKPISVHSQGYMDPIRNTLGIWSRLLARMAQQHLPSDEELHFKVNENNLLSIKDIFPDNLFPTIVPRPKWNGQDIGGFEKITLIGTTPSPQPRILTSPTITSMTTVPSDAEIIEKLPPKRRKLRQEHGNSSASADVKISNASSLSSSTQNHSLSNITMHEVSTVTHSMSSSSNLLPSLSPPSTAVAAITITTTEATIMTTTTTRTSTAIKTNAIVTTVPVTPEGITQLNSLKIRENLDGETTKNQMDSTYTKTKTNNEEMRKSVAEIIASEILKRIKDLNTNSSSSAQRIFIKIRSQNMDEDDEPNNVTNDTLLKLSDTNNLSTKNSFRNASTDPPESEFDHLPLRSAKEHTESNFNVSKIDTEASALDVDIKQNATEVKSENDDEDVLDDKNGTETDPGQKNLTSPIATKAIPTTSLFSLPRFPLFDTSSPEYDKWSNKDVLVPVNEIIDGIGPLILPMLGYRPKASVGYYSTIPNAAGVRTYSPYDGGTQSIRSSGKPSILNLGKAIIRQIYGLHDDQYNQDYSISSFTKTDAVSRDGNPSDFNDRLYQAWLRQFSTASPKVIELQKQRVKSDRYVPVAHPVPKLPSSHAKIPLEYDAKMSQLQFGTEVFPRKVSLSSRNDKIRSIPYKRYIPRPSEYHRMTNWDTHTAPLAVPVPLAVSAHPGVSADQSSGHRVLPSSEIPTHYSDVQHLVQSKHLSPQTDLMSQMHKKEMYNQQLQKEQLSEFEQQGEISMAANKQTNSAGQGIDDGDGFSVGRSRVRSDFIGDTGLLTGGPTLSTGNPESPMDSGLQFGMALKAQTETTPFTPPPNFSNKNNGGFGMGRSPDKNLDEFFASK